MTATVTGIPEDTLERLRDRGARPVTDPTEAEAWLLAALRLMPFGEVTVLMQASTIAHVRLGEGFKFS